MRSVAGRAPHRHALRSAGTVLVAWLLGACAGPLFPPDRDYLTGTWTIEAIDDQPARVLKAGETFYEPSGCLHRVAKNPAAKGKTRVLAVILHPRDAKQMTIPEPKNK